MILVAKQLLLLVLLTPNILPLYTPCGKHRLLSTFPVGSFQLGSLENIPFKHWLQMHQVQKHNRIRELIGLLICLELTT